MMLRRSTRFFSSASAPAPRAGVDWENFGFKLNRTEHMYLYEGPPPVFQKGKIMPYASIALEPAATVLNYGQGLFEGLKAQRQASGRVVIFRPDKNHERCNSGCKRLLMPELPKEVFFDALRQTTRANGDWIPPTGKGALYLRPVVFGSGAGLGVNPAQWYHFIVYACPVGPYFKKGSASGIDLVVSDFHRAAPRGIGDTKSITNYAPVFLAQQQAKKAGFSEAVFLDASNKYVEEVGAANFFCLGKDGVIRTPALGSILPGVTRASVIQIARDLGYKVEECQLSIEDALASQEVWCCGTAAVITAVSSITHHGKKYTFDPNTPTSRKLYDAFGAIISGAMPDKHGWLFDPYKD